MTKAQNLRGREVQFAHPERHGIVCYGTVVTRIRGTRWLIESPDLPPSYLRQCRGRRITLDRSEFELYQRPASLRSPLDAMIDKACEVKAER